MNCHRFYP
jgi:hypothetical protein